MQTYINPLTDFGFKRIFGNREILMSFLNDSLYYTTFPIQDETKQLVLNAQGKFGEARRIFFIGILDFKVDIFDDENYIHHGQITDIVSKKVMNTSLSFIYIELTKFKKERQEELK